MEMRKHDAGYAQPIPALDVSLRSAVSNDGATTPDTRLPDLLTFAHVRRACELAIANGDYHTAWRGAQALMRRCPEALIPSMLMGNALLVGDKAGMAITHFRLVITRNAMDSLAWQGLASALTACGQAPAAAAATRRAVCNAPLNDHGVPTDAATAVPQALGMIYLRRGMADMAVVELGNTLRQSPPRNDLQWGYIEALRQSNRLEEAQRLLSHHDFVREPELPLLCLRALLSTASDVIAVTRDQITAMDPDGSYQRAFFAPHAVPWPLTAQPMIGWDHDIHALAEYLLATTKAPVLAHTVDPVATVPTVTAPPLHDYTAPQTRPVIEATGDDGQAHVLLGHRAALVRRFGTAGWHAIDERIQRLCRVLRQQGMFVVAGYIDAPGGLAMLDILPPAPIAPEAMAIRDAVREMAAQLQLRGLELTTLVLIGGDQCIPFHRLQNPIPDDEPQILSDNPYACDDAGYLLPQRIVARLPEGDSDDPQLLIGMLESMAHYHAKAQHQGQSGFDLATLLRIRSTPAQRLAVGVAADAWREPSQLVLRNLHADAKLFTSPPLTAQNFAARTLAGREVVYINLHGAAGMPHFYGQSASGWGAASALPIAISPNQLTRNVVAGAIIISEACYGAELAGRTIHNSVPLKALSEGALAFVGSTVNAYGSAAAPLLGADLLFERMTRYLADGMPIGMALHFARLEFAQVMYDRQGFLDDVDMKTLIEFILLGDPWAAVKGAQLQPTIRHTSHSGSMKLLTVARVPKMVRRMNLRETDVSPEMLRRAKEVLQKYLPNDSVSPLSIVATTNPYFQAKGLSAPDVRFSMKSLMQTSDGQWLPRNAHVTLSNQLLTKAVLSH